jgi:WD40 repeat protein
MYFYDMDGRVLASVNTHQMQNMSAALASSSDLTILMVGAFTSDAKVWEVSFDKVGLFAGVNKIMDIRGHQGSIVSVSISCDTKMAATASKDKSIRLWNFDGEYI